MGRAYTQKYVAVPGTSEHQTGLAVDLRSPGGRGTSFDNSREWRWLRAHAQNYGFVLRYPDGLTKVTGIGFEPWHWRYVGVEQAKPIRALGANMTIEQYLRLA
jgi:D-alanyl-D-alanine carboxypeptidase